MPVAMFLTIEPVATLFAKCVSAMHPGKPEPIYRCQRYHCTAAIFYFSKVPVRWKHTPLAYLINYLILDDPLLRKQIMNKLLTPG